VTTRTASDPWARFGASRGTPVNHTAAPATAATATAPVTATTTRGGGTVVQRNAPDAEAWRHVDATRPASARDATTMRETGTARDVQAVPRSYDAPRRGTATSVQEPPRTSTAPRENRESNAARPVQQSAPPPAAAQQRSAPPPARAEHPPATKSTSPH
jgi:hypothetical protein